MNKRELKAPIILSGLILLFGCGSGSTKLSVTTVGEGIVTSSPTGIECGGSFESCSAEFEKDESITLNAQASDGYVFSGWSGDCSGIDNCTINITGTHVVEASFVVSGSDITPPSQPIGLLNAVDSSEISIAWEESSDDTTDQSQLIYNIYIAESRENLLSDSNLAYQVMGSEPLYISKSDANPGTKYFAAIVAIDGSLNQSTASISSTTTPMETPSIREDISIFFSDEEGWAPPLHNDETSLYEFTIPATTPPPIVGSYIAFPSSDDDNAYLLTAVTEIIEEDTQYILEARPAILMEISDDINITGSHEINPGKIQITTPSGEALAKKKSSIRLPNSISLSDKEPPFDEEALNVSPIGLNFGTQPTNHETITSAVPDAPEDCNEQPTAELNFNAYVTPNLEFQFNFDAASMSLCSDQLKDSDGNCPASPNDSGVILGDIIFDSSMIVTLANEECLYKKYSMELKDGSFNLRRAQWFKKLVKNIPGGKKVKRFAPQFKFNYKLDVDVVYSGVARSAIETETTIQYRLMNMKFGVNDMLTSPKQVVDLGSREFEADAKADVKGDLDYDIYIVPNLNINLDFAGQLEAEWKGDIEIRSFGRISAGTPDPLIPEDLYFKTYTMGAETICYESLYISTGLFGMYLGEIVDQDYENEEICRVGPDFFFAMPIYQATQGIGIVEHNEKRYLAGEHLYTNPPMNEIDWSTAEYGIMLLNGEMINYPIIVQPTYYFSTHAQTGWDSLVIPIWSEYPIPETILPAGKIESTGGGQKFWLRAETKLGRYYLRLSDWQYP